jgi:hypothetical protein
LLKSVRKDGVKHAKDCFVQAKKAVPGAFRDELGHAARRAVGKTMEVTSDLGMKR